MIWWRLACWRVQIYVLKLGALHTMRINTLSDRDKHHIDYINRTESDRVYVDDSLDLSL